MLYHHGLLNFGFSWSINGISMGGIFTCDSIYQFTPSKTNVTMKKNNHLKMHLLWQMRISIAILEFQVCYHVTNFLQDPSGSFGTEKNRVMFLSAGRGEMAKGFPSSRHLPNPYKIPGNTQTLLQGGTPLVINGVYNHYKWPHKWVTGVITLLIRGHNSMYN